MISLSQLLATVQGVTAESLTVWIEHGFVVPEQKGGEPQFAEIDVARVRLIYELEHDLELDADAVALLLSVLDQMYALRSRLRLLSDAVASQPPEIRDAILAVLVEPPPGKD